MSPYIPRYQGPRWSIAYGSQEDETNFALEELYRAVQSFLPYVLEVQPAWQVDPLTFSGHLILLGTPQDNLHVQKLEETGRLQLPPHLQGISLQCSTSTTNASLRRVTVAGRSPAGVLHAVETFITHVLSDLWPEEADQDILRASLDTLPTFSLNESPAIPERGLWTWGYVIYDYRRFLDHMARLRFNCLTIWNDIPPLNTRQLIDYAHERGIKIILGFPWGWGMDYDLADPEARQQIQALAIKHYQKHIQTLKPDGIYFQSLTEHNHLELAGRSVASLTCDLVNQVAARLYTLEPALDIRFGLHATSIRQRFNDLAELDPRITIVWEDAGALPYTYTPSLEGNGLSFEQTLDYSRRLAAFRPGSTFAMVAKGWTCLDWEHEFEHHGPYLIGVRNPAYTQRRLESKAARWQEVNTLWERYLPQALQFYRSILEVSQGRTSVIALLEDGLFEETIQPSVAAFAEALWNPAADADEMLRRQNYDH
jgi:hypothetical protein